MKYRALTCLAGAVLALGFTESAAHAAPAEQQDPAAAGATTDGTAVEADALSRAASGLGLALDPTTKQVAVSPDAAAAHPDTKEVSVPAGGHASATPDVGTGHRLVQTPGGGVLVTDGSGALIGTVDATAPSGEVSLAAEGDAVSVGTTGAAQQVDVTFSPAADATGGQSRSAQAEAKASTAVTVPAEYKYDPKRGALHDYCTSSPDEFPNPFGANADFRGPCARHDLCIEKAGHHDHACDGPLRTNMKANCHSTYGSGATRSTCDATAEVYYKAVTAAADK